MVSLKKYRDGECVKTERFENKEIANKFKKKYLDSYTAAQKQERKIYAKIVAITAKK